MRIIRTDCSCYIRPSNMKLGVVGYLAKIFLQDEAMCNCVSAASCNPSSGKRAIRYIDYINYDDIIMRIIPRQKPWRKQFEEMFEVMSLTRFLNIHSNHESRSLQQKDFNFATIRFFQSSGFLDFIVLSNSV